MAERWAWFDFENTPHVLFLRPLMHRVRSAGIEVRVTAKPQSQTLELAGVNGIELTVIGSGEHVGRVRKVVGGLTRARALARWATRAQRPALLVSSSRTASLAAWWRRIPGLGLLDYEHAEHRALAAGSETLWFPDLLRAVSLPARTRRVARFYAGLKENLYLDEWPLDRTEERHRLAIAPGTYFVVARPPAESAHYASAASTTIWLAALRYLHDEAGARIVVIPRTADQREWVRSFQSAFPRLDLVERAVQGPALVAAADLVLSGGGTMNREAAVLGTPAWSVFTGPTPHIDRCLAEEGRLRWVRNDTELASARRAGLPERLEPRGPFPEGINAITRVMLDRLGVSGVTAA